MKRSSSFAAAAAAGIRCLVSQGIAKKPFTTKRNSVWLNIHRFTILSLVCYGRRSDAVIWMESAFWQDRMCEVWHVRGERLCAVPRDVTTGAAIKSRYSFCRCIVGIIYDTARNVWLTVPLPCHSRMRRISSPRTSIDWQIQQGNRQTAATFLRRSWTTADIS